MKGNDRMPQSLARAYMHLIFSTKGRIHFLHEDIRDPLHAYCATVLANLDCQPTQINSVEDHIHILFDLGRTTSISKAVENVKSNSSRWLKTQERSLGNFSWQNGYAAFAVEASNVRHVQTYIVNQAEHHHSETFQEEYRRFLTANGIEFDEQYMWD